jgi:PAS domain-containing protein
MERIASFYDAPMNQAAGFPHDFRLVFYPSHPDSYELTHVLLAKARFDGQLELSPAWERVLGFGRGELRGKTLLHLMWSSPRYAAAAVAAILGRMDRGPVTLRVRCRDGRGKGMRLHRRYDRREQVIYIVGEEIPAHPAAIVTPSKERRAVARNASPVPAVKALYARK